MKGKFFIAALAVAMAACSTGTSTKDAATTEEKEMQNLSLDGKWRLADFAGDSAMEVMDTTQNYYLQFVEADKAFNLTTDCNLLSGNYSINGDSINFGDMASTMRLCPDEKIENAMKTILPMINTYAITPDSMLLLRADMRTMARFAYEK